MQNKTLMQYFEWDLPANGLLWQKCKVQAAELKKSGIDMVWLPPAYKGAAGNKSVGYDVYDTYDLGEFMQKNSVATKYGTKDEYLQAIDAFHDAGIEVLADVVFNHRMGADETEDVTVVETAYHDRNYVVSGEKNILAWTKFTFPGRGDKYSSLKLDSTYFTGTDWDEKNKQKGIYLFKGKNWNKATDNENNNFDYLMGADLDVTNPATVEELERWGKWYLDITKVDGFRLDAVKHISHEFYENWLASMRQYKGQLIFAVGEYWSDDLGKLHHYLDESKNAMTLFDVPLHFAFYQAATSNGQFDMGALFCDTLVGTRPNEAVTFVDNHDTQPGQALCSYIPKWFKPIAYALILLQKEGIPCVFYGDYYGLSKSKIAPVVELKTLLKIRKAYAYGEEIKYYDHHSVVGFTRTGDEEHPNSGLAVLVTDSVAGEKRMYVGKQFAGQKFYDALGNIETPVDIDAEGHGIFKVEGGSVSVWVTKEAYNQIWTEAK